MQKLEIIFYDKKDGTKPAMDFITRLDKKMRAKMLRTIKLLRENGAAVREPLSKSLGDGIFELRAQLGSDISRVLYFLCCQSLRCPYSWFYQENGKDAFI